MTDKLYAAKLETRALITVSGADARDFLQGLITQDMRKLLKNQALYGALLSPQGKFLHDFFILEWQGQVVLDCLSARANDLMGRLKLYALRREVKIQALQDKAVYVLFGGQVQAAPPFTLSDEKALLLRDPRLPELGLRVIGEPEAVEGWLADESIGRATAEDYDAWRMELGVPEGGADLIPDKSLLLEYGMDRLHAVDFSKGCYVGQEVTARMHYRANIRKNIYKVEGAGELPEAGTPVMLGDKEVGELRSHVKNIGLALLRMEDVAQAALPLTVNGISLTASLPAWNTDGN